MLLQSGDCRSARPGLNRTHAEGVTLAGAGSAPWAARDRERMARSAAGQTRPALLQQGTAGLARCCRTRLPALGCCPGRAARLPRSMNDPPGAAGHVALAGPVRPGGQVRRRRRDRRRGRVGARRGYRGRQRPGRCGWRAEGAWRGWLGPAGHSAIPGPLPWLCRGMGRRAAPGRRRGRVQLTWQRPGGRIVALDTSDSPALWAHAANGRWGEWQRLAWGESLGVRPDRACPAFLR